MNYTGNQTRQDQNYVQMYYLISNFIAESAHLNIVDETHKYTVQITLMGELLFKLLAQKIVIGTKSTSSHLRKASLTLKPTLPQ